MIFSNSALILPLIFCGKDGNKNDGCNHKIPTVQVYGILIHLKLIGVLSHAPYIMMSSTSRLQSRALNYL